MLISSYFYEKNIQLCLLKIVSTNLNRLVLGVAGQVALRPSELFYNKLTPLLKEAGVSVERRKEWPLPLLKQVLQELMKETPSHLLAKLVLLYSRELG